MQNLPKFCNQSLSILYIPRNVSVSHGAEYYFASLDISLCYLKQVPLIVSIVNIKLTNISIGVFCCASRMWASIWNSNIILFSEVAQQLPSL